MKWIYVWLICVVTLLGIGVGLFLPLHYPEKVTFSASSSPFITPVISVTPPPTEQVRLEVLAASPVPLAPTPLPNLRAPVLLNVPFLVQAPLGQWSERIYENACEEASMIMAMQWLKGETKPLSAQAGTKEIATLTAFEDKQYGQADDRSAKDTAKFITDYYGHEVVEVRYEVTTETMIAALQKGSLILVPVNGRVLHNPFYTPPGPVEHMLLVKGYDPATHEFITNDPGTRHGEGYRYKENILIGALQDYPTGNHLPITHIRKVMIVVSK